MSKHSVLALALALRDLFFDTDPPLGPEDDPGMVFSACEQVRCFGILYV